MWFASMRGRRVRLRVPAARLRLPLGVAIDSVPASPIQEFSYISKRNLPEPWHPPPVLRIQHGIITRKHTRLLTTPFHIRQTPDADQAAHHDFYALGDQRLIAMVHHGANLELDKLKLLESRYRGKEWRRWADNFKQSFGDVDGVEEALNIVMRNEGIEGDSAPFISTLVHALRDKPSAQPASVDRREPSLGRALESAQPAAAAATRADSRARLRSWLRSSAVAEIDGAKRQRIIDEHGFITDLFHANA